MGGVDSCGEMAVCTKASLKETICMAKDRMLGAMDACILVSGAVILWDQLELCSGQMVACMKGIFWKVVSMEKGLTGGQMADHIVGSGKMVSKMEKASHEL